MFVSIVWSSFQLFGIRFQCLEPLEGSMASLFDCSMLPAGLNLVLVAGLCLVNSDGSFACWFRNVAVCFLCFGYGLTR